MNGDATIISSREAIAFSVEALSRENASADDEVATMELSGSSLTAKTSSPVLLMTLSVNQFFSLCTG